MPGFFCFLDKNRNNYEVNDFHSVNDNFLIQEKKHNKFVAKQKTLKKFLDDKIFYEDNDIICLLDGVIFNKNILSENDSSWESFFVKNIKKNKNGFLNKLRGTFCGFIYNKVTSEISFFTDQIGSKHIYYFISNDVFVFGTDIIDLYSFKKKNNFQIDLNEQGAYMLLSFGFMLDDNTLDLNIKKILPGSIANFKENNLEISKYYSLNNQPVIGKSKNEIVNQLDFLFRQAIKRQFNKDKEYNYKHLVGLSGGLDSRMTTIVAHDIGYTSQFNYTFSQSNYLDEIIPKQISSDLKHEWIFKSLDNGLFLTSIDEVTNITGGNVLYYGLAHGLSLYKYLNFNQFGLAHTGQLGDAIIGTLSKINKHDREINYHEGAYSQFYLDKVNFDNLNKEYINQEDYLLNQRGFSGANNGLLGVQQFTETFSPFYDIDFIEYVLKIPLEYRYKHKLYKEWINKKYPFAADYIWEKTGSKPYIDKYLIKYNNKELAVNDIPKFIFNKIRPPKGDKTKEHMNPLNYWYNNNKALKSELDNYFNKNINLLLDYPKLKQNLEDLYNKNMLEKVEALTLVSACKILLEE